VSPDLEQRTTWYLDGHLTRPGRHRDLELRVKQSQIVGWAVLFNIRSRDLGGFVEVVKPQACAELGDIVCLYNHDANAVLGRTPKTLQLRHETRGVAFTLDPADTTAGRDAYELVKRGDVTGASFGFRTKKDAWKKDGDVMIRELLDIELAEISLTAFPAYHQTDVAIAQRSLLAATQLASDADSPLASKEANGKTTTLKPVSWLRLQARAR
jgi:HK97 family phage prohead protease